MRSRAVSLPALCSRSRRSGPPPASASADWRRSSSMRLRCFSFALAAAFSSDKLSSRRRKLIFSEDADGEVSGKPDSAKKQDDTEKEFRTDSGGALKRRVER